MARLASFSKNKLPSITPVLPTFKEAFVPLNFNSCALILKE
ncbi:hypothetical protein [Campylobacter armoricus]|nr:hypothetical protein [Campylobacter armoricus]